MQDPQQTRQGEQGLQHQSQHHRLREGETATTSLPSSHGPTQRPPLPFTIKFKTSPFSKYQSCVIKPPCPKKSRISMSAVGASVSVIRVASGVVPNIELPVDRDTSSCVPVNLPDHAGEFAPSPGEYHAAPWEGAEVNVAGEGRDDKRSKLSNRRRSSSKSLSRRRRHSHTTSQPLQLDHDEILRMYDDEAEVCDEDEDTDEESLLERLQDQKDIVENIKLQPWPMHKKLQILSLARAYIEKHEGNLSRGQSYHKRGKQLLKQFRRSWNNFVSWVTPWEMRIKRIESHFGSVVTSYFVFLRWLVWINIWLTLIQVCFVIIPELLVGDKYGTTERKSIPEDEVSTAYDLMTILDAEGIARYSPLFYGYYGNAEVIGQGYRLPLAYMVTTLLAFAYSFIAVLQKMASNARQSRMSNKDEEFVFTWKLFTDWDFMVGHIETATTKHASIITTFKEAIMEEQEKAREGNKYVLITVRVLANVLITVLLGLSTYVIQVCVDRSRKLDLVKQVDKSYDAGFWAENELTIVLTLITTVFPAVVDIVAVAEKYHPRTNLRMQLARIFLLNLLNMYTFFIALYYKQNDLKSLPTASVASQLTNSSCNGNTEAINTSIMAIATTVTVPYMEATTGVGVETVTFGNVTVCPTPTTTTANGSNFCWETMIGQEVVKLTVMDTVTMVVQIIIAEIFRSYFIKYCNNICCWDLEKTFPEYPDFKTAENLLALITNQGMIWLGLFFAPGLTLLNLLKLLLLMYVRCWATLVSNVPEERIFRASRSNNFYFALLLVMLFLCMLPPLFAIVTIEPSPRCGPFSGYQKSYDVLTRTMETLLPASINSALKYAASPGVIIPVFMLLGMTIYYLVSTSRALREANNELRMMLEYERTEGRRKVYAMADAKQGMATTGKENGANTSKSKFTSTASSVLKMAQMAKIITNMTPGKKTSKSAKGEVSRHKVAPAVRPKPQVPVAVVHGKRSLKRVAAAAAVNKFQHRAPPERESGVQRRLPERSQPVAGGVRRPAVVSLDNDDESGDEDMSVFSSVSSNHSGQFIDDATAAVDASGHLRPVTEDDIFLAIQSSVSEEERQEEGTEEIDDDLNDEVERTEGTRSNTKAKLKSGLTAATFSRRTNSQQGTELAPSSVKGTARHWSRHKVQPESLPNITVVDFGEEDSQPSLAEADLEQPHVTNEQRYVEPVVVVENESDTTTTSSAPTKRPNLAAAGRKSRILSRAAPKATKETRGDMPVTPGGKKVSSVVSSMKGEASSNIASKNTSKDTDRQSSKRQFASVLARFQSIEQTT